MLEFILLDVAASGEQVATRQGGGWTFWVMMIVIFVIFYLFMILPQRRKQKELEKKRNAMQPGDKVITAGGIHGIIKKVEEQTLLIEVAKDTVIKIDKASVYTTPEEAQQQPAEKK